MTARLRGKAGFTLTEMMVVVSIVGLLSALAVPNYLDWNRKYQLKNEVSNLNGYLGVARMIAINQNTTIRVTVCYVPPPTASSTCPISPLPTANPTPNQVTVYFRNPAGTDVIQPITMNQEVSLTNVSSVSVSSPSGGKVQDVGFGPMGLRQDSSSNSNLCVGACSSSVAQTLNFMNTKSLNYRIVIQPTGKVAWCYTATCTI